VRCRVVRFEMKREIENGHTAPYFNAHARACKTHLRRFECFRLLVHGPLAVDLDIAGVYER